MFAGTGFFVCYNRLSQICTAEIIFAGNVINFWYHRILVLLEPAFFPRIQLDGDAGIFFFELRQRASTGSMAATVDDEGKPGRADTHSVTWWRGAAAMCLCFFCQISCTVGN